MGQKTNSNLLRLDYKFNEWDSKYYNKNLEELSLFNFQDLEIKNFLNRYFKQYNMLIHTYKIHRSAKTIKLFISYYLSNSSLKNFHDITIIPLEEEEEEEEEELIEKCFLENLIESLVIFTKNKYEIDIILYNIFYDFYLNFNGPKSKNLQKKLYKLRKTLSKLFFKEFITILIIAMGKKKSAKILANFIALKFGTMKRHNVFLNFLKRSILAFINSSLSKIDGIKIVIKGRINGKLRSSSRIIQIGKITLQSMKSHIDYFESISYTTFGTFGIKIWICEKS